MFEKASRIPLRFSFKGTISVEDLWNLPIEDLDKIYISLNKEFKSANEDSLINKVNNMNEELELKIQIVKHIFEVRVNEDLARKDALAKKVKKQKILELIERKKEDSMANMSIEDLQKLLED
jgi:hypothetical protein